MSSTEHTEQDLHTGHTTCSCQRRGHGWRTRWAAVGAALAIAAGVGGVSWAGATNAQVVPSTVAISPCRIMDTRPSPYTVGPRATPLASGTAHTIQVTGSNGNCQIPADAASVLVNVTVVSPGASGFITVYPGGAARPTASNLNYVAGQNPVPNLVNAALGTSGQLSFYASGGPVDLVADITGYTLASRLTTAQLAQNRWDKDRSKPTTVTVGSTPIAVAFDGTNMWVANAVSNNVSKINPTTNTVTATVDVGSFPYALAFDGTSIWVANGSSGIVSKVNPSTNAVVATVTLGSTPYGLAFDGTSIWVANRNSDTVSKINPKTDAVTDTVNVGRPFGVVFDGTSVWVSSTLGGTVSKIDPSTNAVVATVTVGSGPRGMAFDGTSIWVANSGSSTVSKVSPSTNAVVATVPVGSFPDGVVFDGTSVWVSNGISNTVSKFNAG